MGLRIGTSGWNYPAGRGTWNGIFYPLPEDRAARLRRARASTPSASTPSRSTAPSTASRGANVTLGWVRRTPADFEFAVEAVPEVHAPGDDHRRRRPVTAGRRRRVQGRHRAAGRGRQARRAAGAVPAQLPRHARGRDYLGWLLRTFADYPLAVELRHARGATTVPRRVALLPMRHGAAWVQIDEPKFDSSIRQDSRHPNRELTTVLHAPARPQRRAVVGPRAGRRPLQLPVFSRRSWSRIVAEAARGARAQVKKLYLYLNNHFSAQAVANATMLRQMLDEPVTAPMPAELGRALSGSRRAVSLLCLAHGYSDDAIGRLDLARPRPCR